MAIADVYDFELVLPRAVKTVLEGLDLKCYTLEDPIEFTKIRPRVDITFQVHGEASPKRLAILPDGTKRTSCFRGELKLYAITDADEPGKLTHSRYRAFVRHGIAALQDELNGTQLTLHKVQFIVAGNEDTGVRSVDGYQQTTFPFTVDISIQQNAWEEV